MPYFNGSGGDVWLGKRTPLIPMTRLYCDACAESAIPLPTPEEHALIYPGRSPGGRHWNTGFKWAPYYGGDACCTACGVKA